MPLQSGLEEPTARRHAPGPLLPQCRLQTLHHDPGRNHAPVSKFLPLVAGLCERSQLPTHDPSLYGALILVVIMTVMTVMTVMTGIIIMTVISTTISPTAPRERRKHVFGQSVLARIVCVVHVIRPFVFPLCRPLCRLACFLSRLVACLSL